MPDTNGAQFQELLEVGVDVGVFESGLRQIESVYTDFLERIKAKGASGSEVLQIGAVGDLSKQLGELAGVISQIQVNLSATLKDITGGVVATLESFEQTIEDKFVVASKAKIAQSSTEADKRIEDAKRVTKALSDENTVDRAGAASFDGRNAQFNTLIPQRNPAQFDEQDAKKIGDMLALTLNAAKEEQDAYDKVVGKRMSDETKLSQTRDNLVAKDSAYQSEQADKIALRKLEEEAKLSAYREELATKDAAYQSELADKNAQKQVERDAQQLRRRQEAEGQYMLGKGPQAAKSAEPSLLSGLGADVAGLTEFFLKAQAALLIIEAMVLPFKLVASSIKDGWEYMTNLQKSAADLQGVIASNVILSKDFGDNFRLAGEAAVDITKQLQDFSVKTGIEVTQLNSSFKAVVDGGGASFVTQMSQLGTLAEYFALAVKATGKDFQVQRTLVSEIPGLLDGTVSKSSLILRTLGLTKDAWEKIRQEGEAHKNLVTLLEPLLKPYLTVVEQAELRMSALNEQLDLMKNRIASAILIPIWETWVSILQDTLHWLEQNKTEIVAVGLSITNLSKDFAELVSNSEGLSAFSTIFKGFAHDAALLAYALDNIVNRFKDYSQARKLQDAIDDARSKKDQLAYDKALNAKDDAEFANHVRDMQNYDRLQDALGLGPENSKASPIPVLGGKTPAAASQDKLKQVEADFKAETAAMKAAYDEQLKLKQEQLKVGKINQQDYNDYVMLSLKNEKAALEQINEEYKKKAELSGGKAGSIQIFKTSIGKTATQETKELFNDKVKAEEEFAAFKKKLSDIDFKDNLAMIQSEMKAKLAAAQQNGSSQKGLIARLDKEASDQEYKAYVDLTNKKLALSTTTETQKTQLTNELKRKSFEQSAKDRIADAKIAKADLADQEKIAKDLSTQAHQDFNLEAQRVAESDKHKKSQKDILADQKQLAIEYSVLIAADVTRLGYLIKQAETVAKQTNDTTELVRLQKELADLQKQQEGANNTVTDNDRKPGTAGKGIEALTGLTDDDLKDGFKDFKTGLLTAAKGLGGLTQTIGGLINAYKQGASNGGVLGGVGAVAGQVGGIVSSIPGGELIGGAIQGVGQIMGFIGGFFTAAAKKIADEMKKSFDQIVKNYQSGTTNLVDTIAQLEQKRQEAINKLSGKKGGQDQLNQLLPEFDDEIASLKKAQTDLITSFETSLQVLRLHSDALGSLFTTWQDINKQVKDYLDAGGDAAKAAEFLSLSLEKQRESAQQDLADGESQAIQDAINLNDLLKQRIDLVKQFKQQEFDLLNADSIERRQAGSVTRGEQLAQLREQNQTQLDALDEQISLATQKVTLEQTVFNISSDINALHRRDEELQLAALNTQISKWKDLQTIIAGIIQTANGSFALSPSLQGILGTTASTTTVTVNVGGVSINGTVGGTNQNGSDIGNEIARAIQSGLQRSLVA